MNKSNILSALLIFLALHAQAQNAKWCGTMNILEQHLQNNPQAQMEYELSKERDIQFDLDYQAGKINSSRALTDTVYIPVVFHIVHNGDAIGAGENISDAQILSQIDAINEDFALLNANAANIPAEFKSLAGSTKIRFCMALFDPQGNVTNGIVRRNLGQADWDQNAIEQQLKPTTIWNRNKYLNVWSVRMGGSLATDGVLAYAQFPGIFGGSANTDGVVSRFNLIGRTGSLLNNYEEGRTLSHEVGHWLGLYHIWGDDQGRCANQSGGGTDRISDTPDQGDQYFGCPTYPQTSCGSSDMFMNHMDYTNDNCRNMFSLEQCAKMESVIKTENSRKGLATAITNCFYNVDLSLEKVINPTDTICNSDITPLVLIRNKGIVDVSFITFTIGLDNVYNTFDWTGTIAAQTEKYINLPMLSGVFDGYHQFSVIVSNPNGIGSDNNISNDSANYVFQVYSTGNGFGVPFSESFEGGFFPPSDWDIKNYNNDGITWKERVGAGAFGQSANCAIIENNAYTSNPGKRNDALITPPIDMSGLVAPKISFDYAYSKRGTRYDSLELAYSIDCGRSWSSVWKDGGVSMATNSSDTMVPFYPEDNEWRSVKVPVNYLVGQKNVQFKFENITAWGNALYLDNINVNEDPTGIKEVNTKIAVDIFPNPASNFVAVKLPANHSFKMIEVTDNLGRKVGEHTILDPISFLNISSFKDGVYFINLISEKSRQTEKVVIVK